MERERKAMNEENVTEFEMRLCHMESRLDLMAITYQRIEKHLMDLERDIQMLITKINAVASEVGEIK
jgi:hypothetical protein